jgi:hypothetical protein
MPVFHACAFSNGACRWQAFSGFSVGLMLMSVAGSALLFGIGTEALYPVVAMMEAAEDRPRSDLAESLDRPVGPANPCRGTDGF